MQIAQFVRPHSFSNNDNIQDRVRETGRHNVHSQATGRSVARALCRIQIGKSDDYLPWLEKSFNHFSRGKEHKELQNCSVMIIDDDARQALNNRTCNESSLYQKLSEHGVEFVDVDEVMNYLKNKYGSNPITETLTSLRKLRFVDGNSVRFNHFLAEALKAICPGYIFSRNNGLKSIAVVDSDSFMPLLPIRQKQLSHKSDHPISLKSDVEILMSSGKKYRVEKAMIDIDFLHYILSAALYSKKSVQIKKIVTVRTRINYAFNEIRSQHEADKVTRVVLDAFDQLNQCQWGKTDEDDSYPVVAFGLKNLTQMANNRLTRICYSRCINSEKSVVDHCATEQICATNAAMLESNLISDQIDASIVNRMFIHLLSDINKMGASLVYFCCSQMLADEAPSICNHKNSLPLDQCKERLNSDSSLKKIILSGSGTDADMLLFKQEDIGQVAFLFSNPLQDWGLRATQGRYRWNPDLQEFHENPMIAISLGKVHALDIARNGNISAITSLLDSSQQPWGEKTLSAEILAQGRGGLMSGVGAGLFDECCSRTRLPDYSLLFKTGRGYLFGGGVGMAVGLGEHIYERYIEPVLPESRLKSCLHSLLPKGVMIAAALQGQIVSAVCAAGGYFFIRTMGQKAFPGHSHDRQKIPGRKCS